ncbi:hypothetical protein V6N13_063297 [Hibiscus sabdariffa]
MGNCCSRGNSEIPDTNEQEASVKNDTNGPNSSSREDSFCNTPPAQQEAPSAQSSGASSKRNRPNIGSVLCRPMEDVRKTYDIKKELGRGQFGVTYLCTHKAKGEQFACKTIAKRKLTNKEDIEDVRREVQIMHHLTGQPNIVELKCAYEDRHSVHLVMELCTGGELFDRIIAKGNYTERAAASLLRTIVQTVHTCHSMGVFHRDLKPENFLLLNQEENSPLKATDFGLSLFYKPARLKQFKAMNNFKKVAMRVVAGCLSEEEIRGMKEMFKGMDTDNSGTITLEELKQCLAKQGTKITESEIKQLMEAADADGTRTIDYEEFITAIMRINRMDREEHLYQAFQHFDKDDSGYITTEELEQALREYGMHDGENIKEIISEVDSDNTNAQKTVPEFRGWDGVDPGSLGYTMEFSQARASRKKQKSDARSSLGSEQDLIAVPLPQSHPSRQDNNQDSSAAISPV